MLKIKSLVRNTFSLNRLINSIRPTDVRSFSSPFLTTFPPGHFYSPIPNFDEIFSKEASIFKSDEKSLSGIQLREQEQIVLLEQMARYYKDLPFPDLKNETSRFYYQNPYFSQGYFILDVADSKP